MIFGHSHFDSETPWQRIWENHYPICVCVVGVTAHSETWPYLENFSASFPDRFRIWLDSLDGGSARRNACTYTGQRNAEGQRQTFKHLVGCDPSVPTLQAARSLLHSVDPHEQTFKSTRVVC
jgi:hypothetical protein